MSSLGCTCVDKACLSVHHGPKSYRIIVGPFESDNTWILVPKGHSYEVRVNKGD